MASRTADDEEDPRQTPRTRQGTAAGSALRAFAHCRTQARQLTPSRDGEFR